jgi:hypothetical protein
VKKFLIVLAMIVTASLVMGAGCFISNLPPIITSDPVKTATVGEAYTYDVEATDPNADVLTYFLTAYPSGMTIDSATGLIKWKPTIEGDYDVTVKVSDGDLDITQSFSITVAAADEPVIPNKPPEITSSAITSGKVGVAYCYDVNATDPEEDTLTYYLTEKPLDMSIVATTGIISWTPTDAGLFAVGIKVSDGELSDTQSFSITVIAADEEEPEPDPVVLVGIAVEPETMELVKRKSGTIVVTACYEVRGWGVTLENKKCLFLTSDSKVATVNEDGLVTAVGAGTANILVSYEKKFATLGVTVTYLPMEIKADMPLFTVDDELKVFRVEIVANDDKDENVLVYFTLPTLPNTDYELEFYGVKSIVTDLGWHLLASGEEVVFGYPSSGFDLKDDTVFFRATFDKAGTYETTAEVWIVDEYGKKDEKLCSKDITAKVIPPEPLPY